MKHRSAVILSFLLALSLTAIVPVASATPRVAFDSSRGGSTRLWSMGLDGKGQKKVGSGYATAYAGRISPDGTRVVFMRYMNGQTDVFVADVDGGHVDRLSRTPTESDWNPTWSPSGKKVVYTALDYSSYHGYLVVQSANGGNAKHILDLDIHNQYIFGPAWSPNGKRILVCRAGSTPADDAVMAIRPDGLDYHVLVDRSGEYLQGVTYSPDGKHIAFGASSGGDAHLFVAKADGTGANDISGPDTGFWPVWPVQGKILFTSYDDGDSEVYSIKPNGTSRRQLTKNTSTNDNTGFFT